MEPGNLDRIIATIIDRLRLPWPGGAKKIPAGNFIAIISVLFIILFGAISFLCTLISYLVFLPSLIYTVHRYLRYKSKLDKQESLITLENTGNASKFYITWLISSVSLLIILYYTTVITTLKITAYENFIFLFCTLSSTTSLFLVKATACEGFEVQEKTDDDVIESGAWRICSECQRQVPRQASHCRTCDTCFLQRDHHCLW